MSHTPGSMPLGAPCSCLLRRPTLLPFVLAAAWGWVACLPGIAEAHGGQGGADCGGDVCRNPERVLAETTFRIGFSYSNTTSRGHAWAGPPDPLTVWRTAEMMVDMVNGMQLTTASNQVIRLELLESDYGWDDHSNESDVRDIYEWYSTSNVDLLLCPSRSTYHHTAAEALEGSGKLLICWSSEVARYYDFPVGQIVPMNVITHTAKLYREHLAKTYTMTGSGALSEVPESARDRLSIRAREQNAVMDMESFRVDYPDGMLYSVKGLANKFDVNVPFSQRWNHALKLAREHGAESLYVIQGPHAKTVGANIIAVAESLGYTDISVSLMSGDGDLDDLANYSNALSRALPDVLMPLVSMEDTITMVGLLRMYEYAPRVILLNFFETLLATALEGFVVNQMHFPMVWSPPLHAERVDEIFGDFSVINQTYMENYFTPEEFEYLEPILQSDAMEDWMTLFRISHERILPLPSIQMTSAVSVWLKALARAASTGANDVADAMRQAGGSDTSLGQVAFDAEGKRVSSYPYDGTASAEWTTWPYNFTRATNYMDARWAITIPPNETSLLDPYSLADMTTNFTYPKQEWKNRQYQLYPCEAGCFFDGLTCVECAPGRKRTFQDLECIDCENDTYQNSSGSISCLQCLAGADCSDKIQPAAMPEWYRLTIEPEEASPTPAPTALELGQIAQCPTVKPEDPSYKFFECPNSDACLGRNDCNAPHTGILCAQCEGGNTYEGITPGMRHCQACPHSLKRKFSYVAVALVWALLLYAFEMSAWRASTNPSSGTCALLRTLIRYIQLIGVVCEGINLDEHYIIAAMLAPFDVFFRPLSMIAMDCEDWMTSAAVISQRLHQDKATTYMISQAEAHLAIFVVAICFVFSWHVAVAVLEIAWRASRNFIIGTQNVLANKLPKWRATRRQARMPLPAESPTSAAEQEAMKTEAALLDDGHGIQAVQLGKTAAVEAEFVKSRKGDDKDNSTGKDQAKDLAKNAEEMKDPAGDPMGVNRLFETVAVHVEKVNEAANAKGHKIKHKVKKEIEKKLLVSKHKNNTFWKETSKRWSDFMRVVLAWVLLWSAPMLRGLILVSRCRTYDVARLVYDYRLRCTNNQDLVDSRDICFAIYGFTCLGITAFLIIVLRFSHAETWNPLVRRMSCILFDGYKYHAFWWEVSTFLKFALLIFILYATASQVLKAFLCLVGIVLQCMLVLSTSPHEHRDREICKKMEIASLLGAALAIIGQMSLLTTGEVGMYSHVQPSLVTVWEVVVFGLIAAWNICVLIYGLSALFFTELVLQMQVSRQCGCELGVRTGRFLSIARMAWGLNEIRLTRSQRRGVEHLLVHTENLTASERKHLDSTLRSLLQVCTSTGHKFYPSLVVVALNEGFERAIGARAARMRARYERNGSGTQPVFKFSPEFIFRVGTLFLPLPDMPRAHEEDGVTVEELGYACDSVSRDISEYNPVLREKLGDAAMGVHREVHDSYAKTWEAATSVQTLWQDMLYSGGLSEQGGQGEMLRNLCRDYAHNFEPASMRGSRWKCMSGELQKRHIGKAKNERFKNCSRVSKSIESLDEAGANSQGHGDWEEGHRHYKCAICGLELCGYCRATLMEEKKRHEDFLNHLTADTWHNEEVRITELTREQLLAEIKCVRQEVELLDARLSETGGVAEEEDGEGDSVGGSPRGNASP